MSQGKPRGRSAEAVMTHNHNGYRRGCRCQDCRDDEARRRREQRHSKRRPCGICLRVHRGACVDPERRSVTVSVSLPSWLHAAMVEQVPWGERSRWLADLAEKELGA